MVVSHTTARRALEIIQRYVRRDQVGQLLSELTEVPGNKSFKDSVSLLLDEWRMRWLLD